MDTLLGNLTKTQKYYLKKIGLLDVVLSNINTTIRTGSQRIGAINRCLIDPTEERFLFREGFTWMNFEFLPKYRYKNKSNYQYKNIDSWYKLAEEFECGFTRYKKEALLSIKFNKLEIL